MSKPKFRIAEIIIVLLVVALATGVGVYHLNNKQDTPRDIFSSTAKGDKTALFPSKDSSSCVACHTSEAVIAASTFGQDKAPVVNTGG